MTIPKAGALILAAGLSTRMKEFKPLLRVGGKRLIEHAITLFAGLGIPSVTVVGHRSQELMPIIARTSSRAIFNQNFQDGMFSSIQCGVKELSAYETFFLLPVDIPLVHAETIAQLLSARGEHPSHLIYYPQYLGKRGHPPLISTKLIPEILGYSGTDGMRGLLRNYANKSINVPVADRFITMDADTREDFYHLRKHFKQAIGESTTSNK